MLSWDNQKDPKKQPQELDIICKVKCKYVVTEVNKNISVGQKDRVQKFVNQPALTKYRMCNDVLDNHSSAAFSCKDI